MIKPSRDYPEMYNLIGGWFHQDFDIVGHTIEDVIAAYRKDVAPEYREQARNEILQFLEERNDDQVKEDFQRFNPGVDPEAWGMSTRQWLLRIAGLLQ
jgi:hypothetical protein